MEETEGKKKNEWQQGVKEQNRKIEPNNREQIRHSSSVRLFL